MEITDRLNGSSTVTLTEDSMTLSGRTVEISGELIINGQPYRAHEHSNGNNGSPTGGVI